MAKAYDVVIKGGVVVGGSGMRKADVGILGEKIVSVEPELKSEDAGRLIDAAGKYVLPGVIDVHTHPVYEDDMGGLSRTAAYGGTTTLIHFAYAKPGTKLLDTVKKFIDEGLQKSYLDFGTVSYTHLTLPTTERV